MRLWSSSRTGHGLPAIVALIGILAVVWPAAAQAPPDSSASTVDEAAPLETLGEEERAGDAEDLLEQLAELRANPLDVNTATGAEMAQVPGLGHLAAGAIVAHRRRQGRFTSIDELLGVEHVGVDVLAKARPYLVVRGARQSRFHPTPRLRDVVSGLRFATTQRIQQRLDLPRGYLGVDSSRTYRGSPARVLTRAQLRYRRNLLVNLTLEKDPGESFGNTALGYDHVSASAGLIGIGRIDALVIGDFVAEFGQGLALWRAAGMGKGSEATRGPVRSGRGLRPYSSAEENRFLRGAGVTIALTTSVRISAFASRRRLDASVAVPDSSDLADGDLPPGSEPVATSMTADGLHRTPAEIARRGALGETVAGGAVEVQHVARLIQGRVGIVGYRAQFDTPLAASDRPDARYAFRGSAAGMSAAYGEVRSGALHAFGEAGRDAGGTVGAVAGAGAALGRRSEVLVLMRHYPRGFVSLHGYPFGERSGAGQNERGVYAGVRVTGPRWTVSGYLDLYRFPWLRFNVPRPTAGREALVFVEYRPRRWVRAYIQGRIETRDSATEVPNGIASSTVGGLEQDTRRTARLHVDLEASRSLRLRFRVESAAAGRVSRGLLAFQDIRYIPARGVRLDARLTLFETDDYDARLYQLESDVAGAFSLPVLYGRGARAYLAVTLGPYGGFTLQGKLASTFLEDTTGIGTGPDRIDGHRVADAGVQLRWGI